MVTIKVGAPYSNTRTVYDSPLQLTLVASEGCAVFRAKLKERLGAMKEIVWDTDAPIILRPTANTRQANYEALASDSDGFQAQLFKLWKLAARRKQGYAAMFN